MAHTRHEGMPGHVSGQEMGAGLSFFTYTECGAFSGGKLPPLCLLPLLQRWLFCGLQR